MDQETRYRYEKRIKALEKENSDLRQYRLICLNIFSATITNVRNGTDISLGYILEQYNLVFL